MAEHSMFSPLVEFVAQAFGYVGVGFIIAGTIIAFLQYLNTNVVERFTMPQVRLTLGTYILVGLEFMIGQDIVETVINTQFEHLISLGVIVVVRTILEYFVGKEVEYLNQELRDNGVAIEYKPPRSMIGSQLGVILGVVDKIKEHLHVGMTHQMTPTPAQDNAPETMPAAPSASETALAAVPEPAMTTAPAVPSVSETTTPKECRSSRSRKRTRGTNKPLPLSQAQSLREATLKRREEFLATATTCLWEGPQGGQGPNVLSLPLKQVRSEDKPAQPSKQAIPMKFEIPAQEKNRHTKVLRRRGFQMVNHVDDASDNGDRNAA